MVNTFSKVSLGTILERHSGTWLWLLCDNTIFSPAELQQRFKDPIYSCFQMTYIPQEWPGSYCMRSQIQCWEHQCESCKFQQQQNNIPYKDCYTLSWNGSARHFCPDITNTSPRVRVTIAVMKPHDQSNLGKKGFIQLTLPHCCLSLKEVRTGIQTGQKPGGKSWWRGHGIVLFTWPAFL